MSSRRLPFGMLGDRTEICPTVGHIFKGGMQMADSVPMTPPRIKTETKLGNTTYIVTAHYAPRGVTLSQKIKRLLDKETRKRPG